MSERLKVEQNAELDKSPADQEAAPERDESRVDSKIEKQEAKAEVDAARKRIHEIHKTKADTLDDSAQSASKILSVPRPNLAPVVNTVAKTWGSIRQNLSPSEQFSSRIIHNPVVEGVSEFTAKTLARPYAILAGGIVAIIGSTIYLYLTRHLGYQYNYFVPILLFVAGLAAGIIVELFYKLFFGSHKANSK